MPKLRDEPVIPCRLEPDVVHRVNQYADALRSAAAGIGTHGMPEDVFWESGLFHSAVERLRGSRAASTSTKKGFVQEVLKFLKDQGRIAGWKSAEATDRHDFEVQVEADWVCVIEAKGCLDGNNTNIFERPPNADEFVIWSLCQNAAADPRKNVWSGIHTRLSAEIIHRKQVVDGLIVWDSVCGTLGRPCPKLRNAGDAGIVLGKRRVPPPCIYLFPRTVPDPRNNKKPPVRRLAELKFLHALHAAFHGGQEDLTQVVIEALVDQGTANILRKTTLIRRGTTIRESKYSPIKRAR
ncbi:MAG: hypothetical protein ACOYX1_06500 [Acidobacteriota bacterium]